MYPPLYLLDLKKHILHDIIQKLIYFLFDTLKEAGMSNRRLVKIALVAVIVAVSFIFFSLDDIGKAIAGPAIPEETEKEQNENAEKWDVSLAIYDSKVNGGKTALTAADWDGSQPENGFGQTTDAGEPRTFTVQITYRNTSAAKEHGKGDLRIRIPDLSYGMESAVCSAKITVGANDSSHSNYDWDYKGSQGGVMTFTNAYALEEGTNLEGSIQIAYEIRPEKEENPERFKDECFKEFSKVLKADLYIKGDSNSFEKVRTSNEVSYHYKRTFKHPWKRFKYHLEKNAARISSFDGLGENAEEYIWVRYSFNTTNDTIYLGECAIRAQNQYILDELPQGVKVFNADTGEQMAPVSGNTYKFFALAKDSSLKDINRYIVGYPKKDFKEEDGYKTIVNTGKLYGKYEDRDEDELLDDASVTVKLADFDFSYPPGNLYGISKMIWERSQSSYKGKINYESLIGEDTKIGTGGKFTSYLWPFARYTGKKMDVRFGDDLLYITGSDGKYRQLRDEEYYFNRASMRLMNGNNLSLSGKGYQCELWVRSAGQDSYHLRNGFEYEKDSYSFSFTKDEAVAGYYFVIKDVNESVRATSGNYSTSGCSNQITINGAENISRSGTIFNFDFVQVLIDGKVVNTPSDASYSTPVTKSEIMKHDQSVYGMNMQRAYDHLDYVPYDVPEEKYFISVSKIMTDPKQDGSRECFYGETTLKEKMMTNNTNSDSSWHFNDHIYQNYYKGKRELKGIDGFDLYDLLPEGMITTSSEKEILDSLSVSNNESTGTNQDMMNVYKLDGTLLGRDEFYELTKENTKITIKENYKGTGRTMIHIVCDYSDDPLVCVTNYFSKDLISFKYNYEIPYDSYLEFGGSWTNYAYLKYKDKVAGGTYDTGGVKDDGHYDEDVRDIDGNGNISEDLAYAKASQNITSVVSTFQDVSKYVRTKEYNYSPGLLPGKIGEDYSYKLRVRTGRNNITDLVIYDSVENYKKDKYGNLVKADEGNPSWRGEFKGVDTSFAESQGYIVKVFYSEEEKPGEINKDDSWKEYSSDVDNEKVKSLAFQYLDESGAPAVIPQTSLTYVEINMKAPENGYETARAYNGCWTFWRAIDDNDRPVDFITGINSNTVQLSLFAETEVRVSKKWTNDDEREKPDSVTVILYQNGKECSQTTISEDDDWEGSFSNLPKYDNDGKEYIYTVKEKKVKDYVAKVTGDQNDGFVITNTPETTVSVRKIWDDEDDLNGKRPDKVVIRLYADGEDTGRIIELSRDNDWRSEFTDLEKYSDGEEIEYEVREDPVEGFESNVTGSYKEGFVIENKYIKPEEEEPQSETPKTSLDKSEKNTPDPSEEETVVDEKTYKSEKDVTHSAAKKVPQKTNKSKASKKKSNAAATGDDTHSSAAVIILLVAAFVMALSRRKALRR